MVISRYIGQAKTQQNPPSKQILKTEKEYMVLEKTSVIKGQNQDVGCPSFIDFFLRKQMKLQGPWFYLCYATGLPDSCGQVGVVSVLLK